MDAWIASVRKGYPFVRNPLAMFKCRFAPFEECHEAAQEAADEAIATMRSTLPSDIHDPA
jgi:hypothetical protein